MKSVSKIIRSVDELPAWFDMKNYAALSAFSCFEWAQAIELRMIVRDWGSPDNAEHQTCMGILKELHKDPTFIGFGKPQQRYVGTHRPQNLDFSTVRSMSVMDAHWCAGLFSDLPEQIKNSAGAVDRLRADTQEEQIASEPFDRVTGYHRGDAFLSAIVDLQAPDELILDEFAQWLQCARKVFSVPASAKRYTPERFSRWIDDCLLPYFDLTEWARQNDIQIPLHVLGAALASPSKSLSGNEAEWVRRTVRRNLQKVFSQHVIAELRGQAAADAKDIPAK